MGAHVYLRDRQQGTTEVLDPDPEHLGRTYDPEWVAMSADGRDVVLVCTIGHISKLAWWRRGRADVRIIADYAEHPRFSFDGSLVASSGMNGTA